MKYFKEKQGMIVLSIVPDDKAELLSLKAQYSGYYFEYRLDLADNWLWLDGDTVDEQVILTLRDSAEAGGIEQAHILDINEKLELLWDWQKEYGCMIDIELRNLDAIKEFGKLDKDKLLVSWHSFGEYSKQELAANINAIENFSSSYGKIALNVENWEQFAEICEMVKSSQMEFLAAFMGKSGVSQRCLYRFAGAIGTYAGFKGSETADGQPDIELVEDIGLKGLTGKENISGIIGSEQVLRSLGISYYNKKFQEHGVDAIYLPFVIEELSDFVRWVKKTKVNKIVSGFSVTMPFKEELTKLVNKKNRVVNFWNGKEFMMNTDMSAMREILEQLGINSKSIVLVAGSGGSARTALNALAKYKCQIEISARNFPEAIALAKDFGSKYVIPENTNKKDYDLLINATALGMKGENLLDMIKSRKFKAAIDLPYNNADTPLAKYCHKKERKYVSGRDFWQLQAREQEEIFMNSNKVTEV